MYPAGAYHVAQALHEERERSADVRRRRELPLDDPRPTPSQRWSELFRFPRLRLADAKG